MVVILASTSYNAKDLTKVTSVTLTTKKYCATVTISISTSRHNEVIETTGTLLGRTDRKNETVRGKDVHITYARRTTDKFPVSKLHPCKIGNWDYS